MDLDIVWFTVCTKMSRFIFLFFSSPIECRIIKKVKKYCQPLDYHQGDKVLKISFADFIEMPVYIRKYYILRKYRALQVQHFCDGLQSFASFFGALELVCIEDQGCVLTMGWGSLDPRYLAQTIVKIGLVTPPLPIFATKRA